MDDHLGSLSTTATLSVSGAASGTIEIDGDRDWFRIDLAAGQAYRFSIDGAGTDPMRDPQFLLRNAAGSGLELSRDNPYGTDAFITFVTRTPGTYYLDAGSRYGSGTGGYTLTATALPTVPIYSNAQIADYLTDGYWLANNRTRHAFASTTISYDASGLTPEGRTLAVAALAAWMGVVPFTFVEAEAGADITFHDDLNGAFTTESVQDGVTFAAHVNVGPNVLLRFGAGINSYSFQTYIHEIGHALGLGHAGNYNFSGAWSAEVGRGSNHYLNDSVQATVMSYFPQSDNIYVGATTANAVTPMMADILAIQRLYGRPAESNGGNTTYGFDTNATGHVGLIASHEGAMVAFTIFDTGGDDTLDVSRFIGPQLIDLRSGAFSNIGGEIGNVGIMPGTLIENAVGGSGDDVMRGNAAANDLRGNAGADTLRGLAGNDTLMGGAGNDTLVGGDGADVLDGGDGFDVARYDDGPSTDLVLFLDQSSRNMGAAAGDTLVAIEGVYAGDGNDLVVGDANANDLRGLGGSDTLRGGGSDDVLIGGDGADHLFGGAGADRLQGGSGVGIDYARYDDAKWGDLVLDLAAPTRNTGAAAGDTYSGIEGLVGGVGHDSISGNGSRNVLFGGAGDDVLDGRDGSDILAGGAGADIFRFTTALGPGNVDALNGFEHGVDKISLSRSIFRDLGPSLEPAEFGTIESGTPLAYDRDTGRLFYDAGGHEAGPPAIVFATLAAGTSLELGDFLLV